MWNYILRVHIYFMSMCMCIGTRSKLCYSCRITQVIKGTLAVVSADNLGSLLLGGFKESCTSYRMCRQCMATKEDSETMVSLKIDYVLLLLRMQFTEKEFELRDKTSHEQHCKSVQEDSSGNASKEYGINRNSILNQLNYFHVCDGSLLPDIMHDILEGALQYETKLMLQTFVNVKHYFTLEEFNSRMENLELGYTESKNRPTLLSHKTLNSESNSLKQNGL